MSYEIADGTHNLDRDLYDQVDRVNFTSLKVIDKSPAHYKHNLGRQIMLRALEKMGRLDDDDTDARQSGRAVSMAVFEPEVFRTKVVVFTGAQKRGKSWDEFRDRHAGKEHLSPKAHDYVLKIAGAVRADPQSGPLLTGGRGEVTVAWTHKREPIASVPGYSIRMKGRLDYVNDQAIYDLKRTKNASPDGFGREVVTYFSHVQGAMYVDAVKAATGLDLPYRLIAVEPVAPFVVQVYDLPAKVLELGRRIYRGWLDRLDVCLAAERAKEQQAWPGYATGPLELELPAWAMPDEDDFE